MFFRVDIKMILFLTAGQDRKSAVYSLDGKISYYKSSLFDL